jgi:hypothetical protein
MDRLELAVIFLGVHQHARHGAIMLILSADEDRIARRTPDLVQAIDVELVHARFVERAQQLIAPQRAHRMIEQPVAAGSLECVPALGDLTQNRRRHAFEIAEDMGRRLAHAGARAVPVGRGFDPNLLAVAVHLEESSDRVRAALGREKADHKASSARFNEPRLDRKPARDRTLGQDPEPGQ